MANVPRILGVDWGSRPDYSIVQNVIPIDMLLLETSQIISPHEHDLRVAEVHRRAYVDAVTGDLVLKVSAKLATTFPETSTIAYPADWWEAVKQRWMPAWFQLRWPVRIVTHVITSRVVFPDIPMPPSDRFTWVEHIKKEPGKWPSRESGRCPTTLDRARA